LKVKHTDQDTKK